jgi:hypothetical protein
VSDSGIIFYENMLITVIAGSEATGFLGNCGKGLAVEKMG